MSHDSLEGNMKTITVFHFYDTVDAFNGKSFDRDPLT